MASSASGSKINSTIDTEVLRLIPLSRVAARKTRGKGGIDAVAIAAILRHPSKPPATIIILQFRPPANGICVELPAGLIDASETPETAAIRELREETGYEGKVVEMSPTIVSDPGMTTANMQLATMEVELKEGDVEPEQQLDEGEFIERVIVPVRELYGRLLKYSEEGKIVDARLWHWAAGINAAKSIL
jgi:ADP-ribose pyrophosphatase